MSVESSRGRAHRGQQGVPAGAPASRDQVLTELTRLIDPLVKSAGYDLEEVDVRPAGRRRLVRVVVDADGGVNLDDVATVNQSVSAALDDSDLMGAAPYVLEVTSPGVDRPLTEPRHWRRAAGRLVRVPHTEEGELEGRVVSADETAVVIDVLAGKGRSPRRRSLGFEELGSGKVQVEFRRTDDEAGT